MFLDLDPEKIDLQDILSQLAKAKRSVEVKTSDSDFDLAQYADVYEDIDMYDLLDVPKRSMNYMKRLERASQDKLILLSNYEGPMVKCKFGCLCCLHTFWVTPQKLSQNKYQCPVCADLDRLYDKGFDVDDEELIESNKDALYKLTATCRSCGLTDSAETFIRWKECRACKFKALYGNEYSIDDYFGEYTDYVEVTHLQCVRSFERTLGRVMTGQVTCPYCRREQNNFFRFSW